MKIIFDTDLQTDNVTSVESTSSDSSFPVTNLSNTYTTDLWKAASGIVEVVITVLVTKGSAIEILNTNATSASVTVGTTGWNYALESPFALESPWALETGVAGTTIYSLPGTAGRLWADYTNIATQHIIKVVLTGSATLYAGILRAGNVETFNDPSYNFLEGSNDYSIEKELNNGADYYRKRNVVKNFTNIGIFETRANAYTFKHDIFDAIGPMPLAIKLITSTTEPEFILFAKRIDAPQVTFLSNGNAYIQLGLREVI